MTTCEQSPERTGGSDIVSVPPRRTGDIRRPADAGHAGENDRWPDQIGRLADVFGLAAAAR
jgi:hypothetical protein